MRAKRGGRPQSKQKTGTRFQGNSAGARGTSLRPALPVWRRRPKRRVLKGRSLVENKRKRIDYQLTMVHYRLLVAVYQTQNAIRFKTSQTGPNTFSNLKNKSTFAF
jgi:hypothetical protein